ncbi:MAG TPA: hypothetical protein PKW90_22510, partial [Myxococcota bacterium]|nr:hypothetical protein [Myxococcota bacterium]
KVVSFAVSPEVTTTYRLVASSPNGSFESTVTVYVDPKLDAYDASIAADQTAGLIPVARLTTPAVLTGFGGAAFNFGEVPGDAVMEFIVEGDPWNAVNAFLAVGENTTSSLRFEQWENTAQYGFTRNTIKDYLFTPPVPSSAWPTHLAFAWDSAGAVMNLYVNGSLAGTTTEVSPLFSMPTGQGFLGANEAGGEALMGTIFRVTVYDSLISEEAIRRHASAFLAEDRPALNAYDEAIRAGVIAPVARLFAPVVLPGLGGMPFDFGTVTSAGSLEFIVEGDPDRSTSSSLAAGKNSESMLRYEVWDDTTEVGFTLAAVADYQFTPGVASPRDPTHLVYTWLPDQGVMQVFVDGQLAGTTTKVDPGFGLPLGLGMLGANTDGGEPMAGTILRVTAYDTVLTEGEILAHARAFHPAAVPPVLSILVVGGEA